MIEFQNILTVFELLNANHVSELKSKYNILYLIN